MSEIRQRQVQQSKASLESNKYGDDNNNLGGNDVIENYGERNSIISMSFLDVIRLLVTLVVASCGLSYYMTSSESLIWGYRPPWFTRWPLVMQYIVSSIHPFFISVYLDIESNLLIDNVKMCKQNGPVILTPDQLSLYNGTDPNLPIYLAINGTVFDVSANPRIYGPGGMYGFFAGKDAARAFVTGCFQEDLTSDLSGVEEMFIPLDDDEDEEGKKLTSGQKKIRREQELRFAKAEVKRQVDHWVNFYKNHKKYFEVGKVVGGEKVADKGKKELCEAAKKKRPRRGKGEKGEDNKNSE